MKRNYKRSFIFLSIIILEQMVSYHFALGDNQVPKRVSEIAFYGSGVKTIYLSYGLVSTLEFPCVIQESKIGNPQSLKVLNSDTNPKELTLFLNEKSAQSSNLIVVCERRKFIFDVISHPTLHQDYVKVFGQVSTYNNSKVKVVQSSDTVLKPRGTLLEKSN